MFKDSRFFIGAWLSALVLGTFLIVFSILLPGTLSVKEADTPVATYVVNTTRMEIEPLNDPAIRMAMLDAWIDSDHLGSPHEEGGFIARNDNGWYIVRFDNGKSDSIGACAVCERTNGHNVVAMFHTHPFVSSTPSQSDIDALIFFNLTENSYVVGRTNVYRLRPPAINLAILYDNGFRKETGEAIDGSFKIIGNRINVLERGKW